jgi:hypothetical protein
VPRRTGVGSGHASSSTCPSPPPQPSPATRHERVSGLVGCNMIWNTANPRNPRATQQSELATQQSELATQQSELATQQSELATQQQTDCSSPHKNRKRKDLPPCMLGVPPLHPESVCLAFRGLPSAPGVKSRARRLLPPWIGVVCSGLLPGGQVR